MKEYENKKLKNKENSENTTFPVSFSYKELKENIQPNSNQESDLSKKEIINKAFSLHSKGKIIEAAKYYQYIINQEINNHKVFANYGIILKEYGKLKEAELLIRKAIELKPDYAIAYSNLGNILIDLGKLKDAESSILKAIQLNPNFANAYLTLGTIFKHQGKLKKAESYTNKAIELDPYFPDSYYNQGNIYKEIGKLEDAKTSLSKAIQLKPNFAIAYYNLGIILIDLGHLKDAELCLIKAINLNPNLTRVYYSLSKLNNPIYKNKWKNIIFSNTILDNKSQENKVDIYFARANVLHNEKKYKESSKYLQIANNLKIDNKSYKSSLLINKSKKLFIESDKRINTKKEQTKSPESIFIVGMPRSGSTLLESILSINNAVDDLGETNILEESFIEWKKDTQRITLSEIYWKKIADRKTELSISTNKWLYNYQYVGIIANYIKNAKIIHCYRNPLDNILSIYRAHFSKGNIYSSSIIESTKVYLDQDQLMTKYKERYRSKIYDLNYESLVKNPNYEIKSLISWLDWQWNTSYLSPHLNKRSISTASSIQVRSPINTKSINGWKNYRDILLPAIQILIKTQKYRDIIS